MDHACRALAPPDTEAAQVADAIWQRAKRCGLVQGAVWSTDQPTDGGRKRPRTGPAEAVTLTALTRIPALTCHSDTAVPQVVGAAAER
jgi:hypothetical protein